jgi:hypothetical protein
MLRCESTIAIAINRVPKHDYEAMSARCRANGINAVVRMSPFLFDLL